MFVAAMSMVFGLPEHDPRIKASHIANGGFESLWFLAVIGWTYPLSVSASSPSSLKANLWRRAVDDMVNGSCELMNKLAVSEIELRTIR